MISVFKTSVNSKRKAKMITAYLNSINAIRQWNFDFEDRDNILRVDSSVQVSMTVIGILNRLGFDCEELE
ncbi:MAG: hypothetical protein EOO50_11650 [Flavobacterium sp.]|nr:MAG: hypothetical protein EOO50_11650 [Flavobacterium sp.]